MVSFLTMLAFNNIIKTLFIIDFERMAAVPEGSVMVCMGVVTFISNVAHIVHEVSVRRTHGLVHFARSYINIFLGKVVRYACVSLLTIL